MRDPQCAPDGKTVAFVVSQIDVKEDKPGSGHIWTVGIDGRNERQITSSTDSESSPRFSPDGKYLSFTSSRPGKAKGNQVWLLDRSGGEAFQLTEVKGRLQGYEWSPDSKRLALTIGDPDPDAPDAPRQGRTGCGADPAQGAEADRHRPLQIQAGRAGLSAVRSAHVHLSLRHRDQVARSPDERQGRRVVAVVVARRHADRVHEQPPRGSRSRAVEPALRRRREEGIGREGADAGDQPGGRGKPEWSPDGKWIALLEGDDKKYGAYGMEHLALVASDGSGAPLRVAASEALDRGVSQPRWSDDGKSIYAIVTDDMSAYGVRIPIGAGSAVAITDKPIVLGQRHSAGSCAVAISGDDSHPSEIYSASVVGGKLKFQPLTHQNDALFAELQLGTTTEVSAKSKDGTEVHGLLTTPPGYVAGTKIPMLLRIHGGPNGQDQHSFAFERQWFAANGYAVLAVNYRGSAGRGAKFSRSIWADWGHYEVDDLQAMVDQVVKMGVADPNKLGVGGWSYGGILTDYMIASDTRFKAATSGAGTAFTVAFYGTDQYIIQYDYEIGPPWDPKAWETYQKISYPFLHADRIKTPTLFLGGEKDFNVPVQGGQQMYQALRSLNIDTQLVIYPNEFHGITRPSYVRDRYERYLAWYESHINGKKPAASTAQQ